MNPHDETAREIVEAWRPSIVGGVEIVKSEAIVGAIVKALADAVAREREECARIVEDARTGGDMRQVAAAIRARKP